MTVPCVFFFTSYKYKFFLSFFLSVNVFLLAQLMESCTLKMNIISTTIINNNNKQQLREAEYITHVRFSNETTLLISYTQLNGEKRKRKKSWKKSDKRKEDILFEV